MNQCKQIHFLLPALLAACGSGGTPLTRVEVSDAAPRSLLLVTIDTLRADHLGCYGYELASTPIIDELAATGVRFSAVSSVAPLTFPSHTSIMTGTIPPYHGVRNNASQRALPELITLAEVLQAAGFQTAAFTAAFVLDPIYGLDQGFEHYGATPQRLSEPQSEFEERSASEVNQEALHWLEGIDDDKPFFMWVHYFEPHLPWPAKRELPAQFQDRPYDAEIHSADTHLGHLLNTLERYGRRAETLVVLTSDHGESLGEHGEETHTYFAYEATLRVPLIFQHASLAAGSVSATRVSTVDIMPSVLELFDLAPPSLPPPGASLARQLHGEAGEPRPVYFESLTPLFNYGWAPIQGVTLDDMKYIRLPRPELYALVSDPRELENLYRANSAALQPLKQALDQLLEQNDAPQRALAAGKQLSADERQKLANLGYLGNAGSTPREVTLMDPKDGIERIQMEQRVRQALGDGDSPAAERWLNQLLGEDPNNPIFNAEYGLLLMKAGRHAEAIPYVLRSLQHGLDNATNNSNLGICYFKTEAHEEAMDALEEALEQNPKHLISWFWLGRSQAALGRKGDARASYARILELWDGPQTGPEAGMPRQVRALMAALAH